MKILLFSSVLKSENDEIHEFLYEIGSGMLKKGHEVMIVAAHKKGMSKRSEYNGIKIRRFQYFWPASAQLLAYGGGLAQNVRQSALAKIQLLPYTASGAITLYRAIKEFKPDVVQALWTFPQGCIARFLHSFMKFRFALHVFGAEPFLAKTYRIPFVVTWPAKGTDLLTANSRAALDATVSLGVERSKVKLLFMGGVDQKKFNPKNDGSFIRKKLDLQKDKVVLIVGRVVERKGHRYLVEAMPRILKRFEDAKLVVVGDGPLLQEVKSLAAEKGLGNSVLFPGRVPVKELPLYYAACDVFCLPAIVDSRGETEGGQGIVIGEAMGAGKPVVASRVGGIPDAVKHNVNGLLVEEKKPEMLADAICKVLSDTKLAKRLSKAGIEFVKKENSYDVYVDRVIECYEEMLSKQQ